MVDKDSNFIHILRGGDDDCKLQLLVPAHVKHLGSIWPMVHGDVIATDCEMVAGNIASSIVHWLLGSRFVGRLEAWGDKVAGHYF